MGAEGPAEYRLAKMNYLEIFLDLQKLRFVPLKD
jgi:hypothetical protein